MGFHRNAQRKTCSGATSRYTHTHTHTHTHTVLINTFRTDMWTKPYLLLLLLLLYRNIPQTIHKRKARWKRHILYRNCFLKHAVEERIEWRKEVTGRRGRWCEYLRDELKEKRGYWKLKEVALNRTLWRTGFGRGHGPFLSQTIDWINIGQHRCPSAWCFHVTRWAKLTDTMLYEMIKNPPHRKWTWRPIQIFQRALCVMHVLSCNYTHSHLHSEHRIQGTTIRLFPWYCFLHGTATVTIEFRNVWVVKVTPPHLGIKTESP